MSANPFVPSKLAQFDAAVTRLAEHDRQDAEAEIITEKWPVWLRLIIIVSLSAILWGLIIWGCLALFG